MENIDIDFIESIIKAKRELELANKNFETAEDELIDYYSYQIKAGKERISYLIKLAKQKGYALDMINEIRFKILEQEVI